MNLNKMTFCSLALIALVSGCKKDDDTPSSTGGGGGGGGGGSTFTLTSTPGTAFTIDGTAMSWISGSTWEAVVGSSGTGTWSYSSGYWNSTTNVGLDVELGFTNSGGPPSTAQFNAIFPTGTRNYVQNVNTTTGVEIRYYDGLGNTWSTSNGTDQTGSVFTITAMQAVAGSFDTVKLTATFNCKVYPDGGGTPKTITNGSGLFIFQNI